MSPCTLHLDGVDCGPGFLAHIKDPEDRHDWPEQDLLLFELPTGGRAARVKVGRRGWLTVTTTNFAKVERAGPSRTRTRRR